MIRKVLIYTALSIPVILVLVFIVLHWNNILNAFFPLFLGIILAYLVNPFVKFLEKRKILRSISIILVFILFTTIISFSVVFIAPVLLQNIREFADAIPGIIRTYRDIINSFIENIVPKDTSNEVMQEIDLYILNLQQGISNTLKSYIRLIPNALTIFAGVLAAFVLAYYFIRDRDRIKKMFLMALPASWRGGMESTGRELDYVLTRFIQGQIMVALIIGTLEAIGLYVIKVDYALFLGLVGGASNIIPYFGPYIGAVPAVFVALLDSPGKALWTVIVFIVVQQIDNSFLSPKMMEGKLGLHPVTTLLAVLFGGHIMGILGMIIAVPVVAVLKTIGKRIVGGIV